MEMKMKASLHTTCVGWLSKYFQKKKKKKKKTIQSSRVQILKNVRLLVFVSGVVFKQFRQIKSEN